MLVFLVSVAIRVPNIGRPLSKHHEFCTAVALRVLTIWDEAGFSTYKGLPVMTYPGPTNKYINNDATTTLGMVDSRGNYYYVSHPPLAYYLPYFCFKVLGIKPGVAAIEWFHVAISGLCGWLVYAITCLLAGTSFKKWSSIGLFAATIYWINPATLWFQSNTYMSDMMVQLFFFLTVFLVLQKDNVNLTRALLIGLSLFLAAYITWFGYLLGVVVAGYFVFTKKWLASMVALVGLAAALALTTWQFSSIAGWDAYLAEAGQRFMQRGVAGLRSPIYSTGTIVSNYITSYGILLVLIPFVFVLREDKWSEHGRSFAALTLIPIGLLHVLLSDYSGHDFTTLYMSLPISASLGFLLNHLWLKYRTAGVGLMILIVTLGTMQYYYINPPGEVSLRGDRYDVYEKLASHINQRADPDEVIFVQGIKPPPEVIYYLGRNAKRVDSAKDALEFLQQHNLKMGTVFVIDQDYKISAVKPLYLP